MQNASGLFRFNLKPKGKIMSPEAGWLLQEEIVPRLRGAIPRCILCIGAEDHTELIADGVCMAARMLDRVEQQGKLNKVGPSNIAYYTLQHMKLGRRAGGSSCVDVYGSMTQLQGSSRPHSLHEVVSESETGEEIFELQDVISQDAEDPATLAARKMDWDSFLAGLTEREKSMVRLVAEGTTFRDIAKEIKVSEFTIQNTRHRLASAVLEFMGADIMNEVCRSPRWKDSLTATKEMMAVRKERQH
jgi:DNA-directed RNA polymerase specialized sigma24 family protein